MNKKHFKRRKNVKEIKKHFSNYKNIYCFIVIVIAYYLFYSEDPDKRYQFKQKHPLLNAFYEKNLLYISKKIKLKVCRCKHCQILFIPDYRIKDRQKNCPFGGVEFNHKLLVKKAKNRYRKERKNRQSISEYKVKYRLNLKTGTVKSEKINQSDKINSKKLKNQIIYISRKLNPKLTDNELGKLLNILQKVEQCCKNERNTILSFIENLLYLLRRINKYFVRVPDD